MIVIKVNNKPEISNSVKRAVGCAYGEKFDTHKLHGLMVGCDSNGKWHNSESNAVPGLYAFELSTAIDPNKAAFEDWLAELLPSWNFVIKFVTGRKIKRSFTRHKVVKVR